MLQAKGMGDVLIQTNVNEEWHSGILKNVLFVPDLGVSSQSDPRQEQA